MKACLDCLSSATSAFRAAARSARERAFPQREHRPLEFVRVVPGSIRRRNLPDPCIGPARDASAHLPQSKNQGVAVPQEHDAVTGSENRKVPFQARAGALEAFRHALLECTPRGCRNVLIHDAKTTARQRQEQWRRDDVDACQSEDVFDVHWRADVKQRAERLKKTVDVAFVKSEEQLFLAREIQVDRALGEAGLVGNLGHVRDAIGRAQEQPLRRIQDRVVTLVLVAEVDGTLSNYHGINK